MLDTGLTPVPPEDVIPAVVIATLTLELPKDIVVALANNPFDVAFTVPDPNPVDALTWPVTVAPDVPVIKPEAFIVFAFNTHLCVVVPKAVPTVLEVGLKPVPPDDVIPAVVIATLTLELPTVIVVELAINPLEVAFIVATPNPRDALTWPVTSSATPGAVLLIPTLLFAASTKRVPVSKLTLPDIVCNVPFNVALPVTLAVPVISTLPVTLAVPEIITFPLKLPLDAITANLPILLPSSMLFDVATSAVVFANRPDVVKLAALIVPV